MSFLDELSELTKTAPTVDPELIGFADKNAFLSAKGTARPYHILDDADAGKPTSRREIFGGDESPGLESTATALAKDLDEWLENLNTSEEGEDEKTSFSGGSEDGIGGESFDESCDESREGYRTGDSEEGGSTTDQKKKEEKAGIKMMKQVDGASEERKRRAVKQQVNSWDKLVQLRLKLQPCLQASSRLPPTNQRTKYMSADVSQSHRQTITSILQSALDQLLDLKEALAGANTELSVVLARKKYKSCGDDEEIPSDTDTDDEKEDGEEEEEDVEPKRKRKQPSDFYQTLLSQQSGRFEKFRSDTLSHWYELANVIAKKSPFMNKEVTALDQIQHILLGREHLLTRTRQNRSSVLVFGEEGEESVHGEFFNDDDFYQQLLREVIDKKMGEIGWSEDPDTMGRQWVELEKLKVKAKKKTMDTKASKGRKIRYEVHSKLLGFMAPMATDTLSDERQDELFKSLFGGSKKL